MMKRPFYATFAFAAIGLLLLFNIRLRSPGDRDMTMAQLEFLGSSLNDGGAERMQQIFPEGYLFTWALYGLASAQLAEQYPYGSPERSVLLDRARNAIEHVEAPYARTPFPADLDLPYGAFYNGWSLYLRARYIRAAGIDSVTPELLERFQSDCDRLAAALDSSTTPFLPSYHGAAWPADASVGVAALGIHDRIVTPRYRAVISRWTEKARQRLDSSLGALPHSADPITGLAEEGARGSSLALMSRVLVDADPELAREQYRILRERFADYNWGIPGIREYPSGVSGAGDVDSGPILFGYSGPAIVVGAAAARVHGDEELSDALLGCIEVAGFPIDAGGERRYLLGALPVGDAFIAWARSSMPAAAGTTAWERAIPSWWALPLHLLSIGIALLLLMPLRGSVSRRNERAES